MNSSHILLWTTFATSAALNSVAGADEVTKASILAAVAAQRGSIPCLVLEEVSTRLEGPGNSIAMSRLRVALSGGAFAVHCAACSDVVGEHCGKDIVVWDGETGTTYNSISRSAHTGQPAESMRATATAAMRRSDLWWTLRWFPITATGEADPEDLLSILEEPSATLRNAPETIAGLDCVVIDRFDPDGQPRLTLWLAIDRGYLPIRQEVFASNGALAVTWDVTDILPLPNGMFVPMAGERRVGAQGEEELSGGLRYSFGIATDGEGAPIASTGSCASDFELTELLPPGTKIWDASGVRVAVAGDKTPLTTVLARLDQVPECRRVRIAFAERRAWLGGLALQLGVSFTLGAMAFVVASRMRSRGRTMAVRDDG
jgi:hypothetical protein